MQKKNYVFHDEKTPEAQRLSNPLKDFNFIK